MPETPAPPPPAKKTILRRIWSLVYTAAGLCSGAALMYVSPLVDRVVKPGKPLANFAAEPDGLTVTFQNRYAGEGWWDFGDGSPLEPATPDQSSISHTYPAPGKYSIKLLVRNFVGEEHERTVTLDVSAVSASSAAPTIASLDAVPISADHSAPATFRLVAQTTGAERCLWDLGPDQPLEAVTESLGKQERLVTFATPGQHVIQVTALGGDQAVRRAVSVQVDAPRGDTLVARLRVTDRGTRNERRQTNETLPITLPKNARGTIAIDRRIDAKPGHTIADAKFGQVDPAFANLKLTPSPDRRSVQVTGTLSPTTAMLQAQTPPLIPVVLTQERQWNLQRPPSDVTAAVGVPGSTSLPLPPAAAGGQRALALELRGPSGAGWQVPLPARGSVIEFQGKRYAISATQGDREVRLEVTPATGALTSFPKQ
jgi:PKD repeat protein